MSTNRALAHGLLTPACLLFRARACCSLLRCLRSKRGRRCRRRRFAVHVSAPPTVAIDSLWSRWEERCPLVGGAEVDLVAETTTTTKTTWSRFCLNAHTDQLHSVCCTDSHSVTCFWNQQVSGTCHRSCDVLLSLLFAHFTSRLDCPSLPFARLFIVLGQGCPSDKS
jgi:hypothetical protein